MDPVLAYVVKLLVGLSGLMRPYLSEIGLSMVATLLVIYGNDISLFVKQQIGSLKYFLRLTLFVLFCAIGFGIITAYLTPLFVSWLSHISNVWLGIAVIVTYYIIGLLAQKKGLI
ncbi:MULTISPECIES: DUF3392 domain-containing protein [Hydrogenovibrio]|uniref:DUF3392 domain-containing protein n=1 Tax=Hydrogenovibrio marinus TaxID=28885 RepID=A0A067A2D2_HYDMR|nr:MULTISPECIES: DUF3392 domain-containing protein [Hydrogenovibrio]KDN96771.1 hypothetical protein EI16_11045 [Hydrogenovibrio marinus]MBD3822586.1 DUF3392 domain-containing protein [Thiotrichales bacterium]MPQ75488.1 DUF3392 domain-containing protein [Hydrogenovibrio sp. JE_KL2]BBN59024.1 hypothetical protein HVMH_0618 [Hydrogenovibrio marinus]